MKSKDLEMTDEDWAVADRMQGYLTSRFRYLQELRADLDELIQHEIEIYNNVDPKVSEMSDNFKKTIIPFIYSQVQTIIARLIRSFFEGDNYLKIFMEREEFLDIQAEVNQWAQEEMDKIGLKAKARDYFENGLVSRVAWLVLRGSVTDLPVSPTEKKTGYCLDFDVHPYREVWFDTKAKEVMASDFFIKKVVPVSIFYKQKDKFFNLQSLVRTSTDPRGSDTLESNNSNLPETEYSAKHSSASYTDNEVGAGPGFHSTESNGVESSGTDLVEIYEYWGPYDFSTGKPGDLDYEPDVREITAVIANGRTLIHWEENPNKDLKRKRLIFPITPIAQAGSLIGKGIPQITKNQAEQLNLAETLRMTNFENLIGLLFKYNKNADIDLEEIFNGPGNAIGWDESPQDIDIFNQPNLLRESSVMINDIKNDIQGTTGGVDAVTGGPNIADTATGQQSQVNQANFKFQMMTENCANGIREFVNMALILLIKYNRDNIEYRFPKIGKFLDQSIEELENNNAFDIALRDSATRRDVEQAQWANMVGTVGPLLQQNGGNIPALIKELLKTFNFQYPDRIVDPEKPDQIVQKLMNNPQLAAQVDQMRAALAQQQQGGDKGGQTTPPAIPTAEALNASQAQGGV